MCNRYTVASERIRNMPQDIHVCHMTVNVLNSI